MIRVGFAALAGWVAAASLGACASANGDTLSLPTTWQSDQGASISAVYDRLKPIRAEVGPNVAVGTTERGVIGTGLDAGAKTWRYDAELRSPAFVDGDVVAFTTEQAVVALDAETGRMLWSTPARERSLRGIGDDGKYTVLSLGDAENSKPSLVLAVDRQGQVRLTLSQKEPLGVPAVLQGVVFVPWQNQYVSAVSIETGEEIGRLLMRHLVSQAISFGPDLYFGQQGLVRFDEAIALADERRAHFVALPTNVGLPGDPTWIGDGTRVERRKLEARDKIRAYARPEYGPAGLGIANQRFSSTYYRIALGLDAKNGELRWVQNFSDDIIGGAAATNGFAYCSQAGDIWLTTVEGARAGTFGLGASLRGCTVQASTLTLVDPSKVPSLTQQIAAALENTGPEMAAAHDYLLGHLSRDQDAEVTRFLIELSQNPRVPPALSQRAEKALAKRRTGVEHMLNALETQYDFLSGTRPPPVAALADALLAVKEKRAAPLLARHLNDPSTSPKGVKHAARALAEIAGPSELDDLRTFFALYRATADSDALIDAVVWVAKALLGIGGQDDEERVVQATQDPLTHPKVRERLAGLKEVPGKVGGVTPSFRSELAGAPRR